MSNLILIWTSLLLIRLLYPPRPDQLGWPSPLLDHRESAVWGPEELKGGWGGWVVLPLFDLHAVITFTNTHCHERTNMHGHTTRLRKAHCDRLTHKEQECYIFITDVINTECPRLFQEILIAQQKGLIRSINQWPHWITEIQDKKDTIILKLQIRAAQQTVSSALSSLKLH